MTNETLNREKTIEKLVEFLNNSENKGIIRENQEYSRKINEWYEQEENRLYNKNKNIRINI